MQHQLIHNQLSYTYIDSENKQQTCMKAKEKKPTVP